MRRILFAALCAALAVGVGAYLGRKPWLERAEHREAFAEAETEMRREEAEKATMETELSKLEGPSGREQLVRERGYRKANERTMGTK